MVLAEAAANVEETAKLLPTLQSRSFEVECTLRLELSNREALAKAKSGVADAIALDDELNALASTTGILKGKIFQGLLECLRAAGAEHAQLDNSAKKPGGGNVAHECGLDTSEWTALADRADALRKLVRIKVADDNDLKTARAGLDMCAVFFDGLAKLTKLKVGGVGAGADEFDADEFDALQILVLTA